MTSRLPGSRSPWTQTSAPSQVEALSDSSHERRAAPPSMRSPSCAIDRRTCSSPSTSGPPRPPGGRGCAPVVSTWRSALHEGGEINGRLIQILDRAVGVLAGQPLIHRPREGISLGRVPHRQLHRERERQVWRELRQPQGLRRRLFGGPPDARQPGGEAVTEPVDVVIGPVRRNPMDGQIGPLGNCAASKRRTSSTSVSISSACILVAPIARIIDQPRQAQQPRSDASAGTGEVDVRTHELASRRGRRVQRAARPASDKGSRDEAKHPTRQAAKGAETSSSSTICEHANPKHSFTLC